MIVYIHIMRDESAIIESLHYLLKLLNNADKLKLVKLLYFADKYHLLKYGRQISGDSYFALPYGPIPSGALDILNFDSNYGISTNSIQCAKNLFKRMALIVRLLIQIQKKNMTLFLKQTSKH